LVRNVMDWRVRRSLALMHAELARPLSVALLAEAANLSQSRFSHLFREHTGESPGRYLRNLRLDCALVLLFGSALSIKEVMASVGFNDPSHFTRDFSERYGATPTEVRAHTDGGGKEALDTWLSSRNGQETAGSAKHRQRGEHAAAFMFEAWRDGRAKGA
jgi:transcriptional regulator GlxA family with amidase domain